MALVVVFVQVTEAAGVVDGGPTQQNDRTCHIESPGLIIPWITHDVIEGRLDIVPAVVQQPEASDMQAAKLGSCLAEQGLRSVSMTSGPRQAAQTACISSACLAQAGATRAAQQRSVPCIDLLHV